MTVKVSGLTPDNHLELEVQKENLPIAELGKTFVVFDLNTATEAHDVLDKLMRETIATGEEKGTRSRPYRSLIAVRSKLARGTEDKNVTEVEPVREDDRDDGVNEDGLTEEQVKTAEWERVQIIETVITPEVVAEFVAAQEDSEPSTEVVVAQDISLEDGEYVEGRLESDFLEFDEAHALIVQIRNGLADLADNATEVQAKITLAYQRRAWIALGYEDWGDLVTKEFKSAKRAKLPTADRTELHAQMRKSGMSYRAIAEVTGASKDTVQRDVASVSNETEQKPLDAEVVPDPEVIVGLDGKERKAKAEKKTPIAKPEQTADEKKLADLQLQVATLAKEIPWNKNTLKMIHGRVVKIANLMGTEV